jgi:hypothetical protein
MKQAKASKQEAETLLGWLENQDRSAQDRPPQFRRTVYGYLLLLENCCDPTKDFLDWKPGQSPAEIALLMQELKEAAVREKRLVDAMKWYAGNNSWMDYDGPDKHHPKVRDCGKIAKETLLENAALAAGWEEDISPGTEGWDVAPWRTPSGKLVRADELEEHFDIFATAPHATPPPENKA